MRAEEERKIKHELSLLFRTKPMYIVLERIHELGNDERKVFITVKGFKYTVYMCGYHALAALARV